MAVVYRPTSSDAAKLKGDAMRLGNQLLASGGSQLYTVTGGFILKAVRSGTNAIVTSIEPGNIWAFTNNNLLNFSYPRTVYQLREIITPGATFFPADAPVVLLNPDTSIPEDSILRYPDLLLGATRLTASGNYTDVLSYGHTTYVDQYLTQARYDVPAGSPPPNELTFGTTVRLTVIQQPTAYTGVTLTGTPSPNSTSPRMLRSYAIDEGTVIDDSNEFGARFLPRHVRFKNRFFASFACNVFVVNPETLLYEDHVVVTPVAKQLVLPPFYEETNLAPPDAAEIATEYGLFVARYRSDSLFPVDEPPPHPLAMVWAETLMLPDNPEPTLRPKGTASAFRHAYTYAVPLQFVPDPEFPLEKDTAVISVAIAEYEDTPGLRVGYGVQRHLFDDTTGSNSTSTLYLANLTLDPTAYVYVLYNRLVIEQEEYAVAVRAEVQSITAPNYTSGTLVAGTWEVLLIGATSTITLDLAGSGLQPFSSRLRGEYAFHPTQVMGVSAHLINRVADYIGANRVACLVCDATQAQSASRVDWKIGVFNATTGELIEVRGSFASTSVGPTLLSTNIPRILVGMTVVSREIVDEDDVVTQPAVLTAFAMEDVVPDPFPVRSNYLSRDGGLTWEHMFEGMDGDVYYMGSAARPVLVSDALAG